MARYNLGIRSKARKLSVEGLTSLARVVRDPNTLVVNWINTGLVQHNWGDAVAPYLIGRLTGRPVVNDRVTPRLHGRPIHTTIGSMLGTVKGARIVSWGTGFVDSQSKLQTRPQAVMAVRGPRTRAKLLEQGVSCPEVYGDPALLFSRVYRPDVKKEHDLGVIPHFKERELPVFQRLRAEGVAVIDICGGIESVADQVVRCRRIVSSSLHGLVLGDSYGIPSYWVQPSDRPFGDGFKFKDYLEAVGRKPTSVELTDGVKSILDQLEPYELEWDEDLFVAAAPFTIQSRTVEA